MREITGREIESMTSAELEACLQKQEQALRDLAVANGFDPSSSRAEFMAWATRTPQGRNVDLLSAALKSRGASSPRYAARRLLYIAAALVLITLFMWARSWA